MPKALLPDSLWRQIQSLLPAPPQPRRSDRPGRKRLDDRRCLIGILFVLKMGIDWADLPPEMGCGSGMTCWRRLQYWRQSGVWPAVLERLLADLLDADTIDWSRVVAVRTSASPSSNGKPAEAPKAMTLLQLGLALGLNRADAVQDWLDRSILLFST